MAKDLYHEHVKQALIKDGWVISSDPYIIETKDVDYEVDLGAEKMIAAEKGKEKIAVEVKSFVASSFVYEFHRVLGQFLNYSIGIDDFEGDRILFVAVPVKTYEESFHLSFVKKAIRRVKMKILVFDPATKSIVLWKIK